MVPRAEGVKRRCHFFVLGDCRCSRWACAWETSFAVGLVCDLPCVFALRFEKTQVKLFVEVKENRRLAVANEDTIR